jgi:hypothetical protein
VEIIKLDSYFPQMVTKEDNNDIYEVISKNELLSILSTFKKEKFLALMARQLSSIWDSLTY